MIELEEVRQHVEEFLNITEPARWLSERDRDYKDNKQWTAEQIANLASRKQAPIVDNRIKPKVEGLKGLLIQRRSDPKAYARTKSHEESSEAITDALRYVNDDANIDALELDVFDNVIVEGYGGAIVDIKLRGGMVEVDPVLIPWDRIYYDYHSRRSDFKDVTYNGIVMWADDAVAKSMFKDKASLIDQSIADSDLYETFEDRPRWRDVSGKRKRVRLAHEFYLKEGVWYECVFVGAGFLIEPRESTYLDEEGKPCNPIELVGAYIDRDNNRFGEVRYWIDPQNEINHRRSKFLHMMSARQTYGRKGEQKDVAAIKRELKMPDGHIEFVGNKFGDDFGVIPTMDMAEAQFRLLEESKSTLDSVSFNAQLSGERQGDLSGVAVQSLQMAGMLEVNSLFAAMADWKKRIYRQCWYRIKQHWGEEKWVRVTDDYGKLRWVGLNIGVPRKQLMEEFINDKSQSTEERRQAAMIYQQMVQTNDPRLVEIQQTKNAIPELDMDIVLEQSTNSINVQQEQFRILAELAASRPQEVPFKSLLKLSELRDKDDLIKDIEEREKMALQMQGQTAQLDLADKQVTIQGKQIMNQVNAAKIDETAANTTSKNMDSIGKQISNEQLLMRPDPQPQAVV
jgi:hypothetical protein